MDMQSVWWLIKINLIPGIVILACLVVVGMELWPNG